MMKYQSTISGINGDARRPPLRDIHTHLPKSAPGHKPKFAHDDDILIFSTLSPSASFRDDIDYRMGDFP